MEVSELDPEKFYVVSINPETAPDPETAASLLDRLHESGIRCLVMIGDASVRPADEELLTGAKRLLNLNDPLSEEDRIHLAELLTRAAVETEAEEPT